MQNIAPWANYEKSNKIVNYKQSFCTLFHIQNTNKKPYGSKQKSTYFVTIIFFVSRNPLVIVTKYGGTVRKRNCI